MNYFFFFPAFFAAFFLVAFFFAGIGESPPRECVITEGGRAAFQFPSVAAVQPA